MSTLNFVITDAGLQAAINADATGLQLTLTEVGYGTGIWSPDKTASALQSEFKRLPAGGGENPAPMYVHVAVSDQSSDNYQATEVGIYAGDTLFAVWSKDLQPDMSGPVKIGSGYSAFVFDLLLENVPPDSVTVGDANFRMPMATETVHGVAEIATQSEVDAGSDHARMVTPKTLLQRMLQFRPPGELAFFTTDTPPAGFFALDGSTIPNGVIDYPALANSGSRWITINGNDIVLKDASDFIRGRGSSGRAVGEYQADAIRNISGYMILDDRDGYTNDGVFYTSGHISGTYGAEGGDRHGAKVSFDASRVVPTADENRSKSLTALVCICYGVIGEAGNGGEPPPPPPPALTAWTPMFNGVNSYVEIPEWHPEGEFEVTCTIYVSGGVGVRKYAHWLASAGTDAHGMGVISDGQVWSNQSVLDGTELLVNGIVGLPNFTGGAEYAVGMHEIRYSGNAAGTKRGLGGINKSQACGQGYIHSIKMTDKRNPENSRFYENIIYSETMPTSVIMVDQLSSNGATNGRIYNLDPERPYVVVNTANEPDSVYTVVANDVLRRQSRQRRGRVAGIDPRKSLDGSLGIITGRYDLPGAVHLTQSEAEALMATPEWSEQEDV